MQHPGTRPDADPVPEHASQPWDPTASGQCQMIRTPQGTVVVCDASESYVGVCGPCCCFEASMKPESPWTNVVCAANGCLDDILRLCCLMGGADVSGHVEALDPYCHGGPLVGRWS